MVSAINSVNTVNKVTTAASKEADVKKLVKYVNNEILQEVPDTFTSTTKSALGSAAVFEGLPLFNFLRRNKKINSDFVKNGQLALDKMNKESLQKLLHGEGKLSKRIGEYISSASSSKQVFYDIKAAAKAQFKADKAATKLAKATEKLAKNPNNIFAKKAVESATKKAESTAAKAVAAQTVKTTAETTSKVAKLGKFGKFMKSSGAGFMLAISGIMECFTEVVPTFKELGKEKGMKQAGKSAIRVVGDTAGFIIGEKVGVAAGTAAGTAVATKIAAAAGTAVCPGVGTAIGAVCGFVGGILGSFVMGKITKAITGKTEREKAKEQEENNNSAKIANDNVSLEELKNSAKLKIQEDALMNNGELSEDAKIALKSLNNLEATNPFSA